jgi:hypothetical protein
MTCTFYHHADSLGNFIVFLKDNVSPRHKWRGIHVMDFIKLEVCYSSVHGKSRCTKPETRSTTAIAESSNSAQEIGKKVQRDCINRWCSFGYGLEMVQDLRKRG